MSDRTIIFATIIPERDEYRVRIMYNDGYELLEWFTRNNAIEFISCMEEGRLYWPVE